MSEPKKVNHNNIFESYIASECFLLDILERISYDWKNSRRANTFNRETFEEFVINDFIVSLEVELDEFCDEEFGTEEAQSCSPEN